MNRNLFDLCCEIEKTFCFLYFFFYISLHCVNFHVFKKIFHYDNSGASVNAPYHSETCDIGAPIIKVFGLPLWQDPRSPRNVIQPSISPGNCWPMKGNAGFIVIKVK